MLHKDVNNTVYTQQIQQILNKNDTDNPTEFEVLLKKSKHGIWIKKKNINYTNRVLKDQIQSIKTNRFCDSSFKQKGESVVFRSRGIEWKFCKTSLDRFKFFQFKYNAHLAGLSGICAAAGLQFFDDSPYFLDNRFMDNKFHPLLETLHNYLKPKNSNTDIVLRNILFEASNYVQLIQHFQDYALDYNYLQDPSYNQYLLDKHKFTDYIPTKAPNVSSCNKNINVCKYLNNDNKFDENHEIKSFNPVDGESYNDYRGKSTLNRHIDEDQFGGINTRKMENKSAKLLFGGIGGGGPKPAASAISVLQQSNHFTTLSSM